MSGAHAYYPLAELAERGRLPLGDLLDDFLTHIWITLPAYDTVRDETNIEVFIDQPVGIQVPGVPALELALGSVAGGVNASLRARYAPTASISIELPLTLRVAADVLRPLQPNSVKPDLTRKTLDISLGSARIGFDLDGHFLLDVTGGITLPRCMIGSTGVILSATNVRWLTPNVSNLPPTMPPGFTGLFFEGATIEVPDLPIGQLAMRDVFLGTGGFSGTVQWSDPNATWSGTGSSGNFTGVAVGQLAGFRGALTKVALGFQQNALTACEIEGNVFVPYLDRVLGIMLGLDGNFGLTASVRTPTCRFADAAAQAMAAQVGTGGYIVRADTSAFTLDIRRIEFHAGGNEPAALTLSGRVKLKIAALDLPAVVFQGLRIDTDGQIAVEGGWLDVAQSKSADLKGFPFQITKIGFGADSPQKRWIGLNGAIKLADGLPIGASVEGLRVSWDVATGQVSFSLEGIGLEVRVPGTYSFAGKVAFFENAQATGFRGTLKLKLETLKLTVDAGLTVGRTSEGTDFFFFYLDLGLPAGIPLFSTGAAIYGFSGLLAANMVPARVDGENWYHGYYKRPPAGVTDVSKWGVQRGGFAIGLGTTVGSLPDTGFAFSAKVLLLLVLPGPQLLLQGKGSFLKKKPDAKDATAEGNFEALLVLDVPAKLFQANLAVAFSIADMVEVSGGLDVAFTWNPTPPDDLWHVYLGERSPAERRIHAKLFKILQGDSWLMINRTHRWPPGLPDRAGDFEVGGSIGVDFRFDFAIVKAWLEASILGQAAITWDPQQFNASLTLKGSAGISALGLSIVADLLADARVKAPSPWHISILVEVGIKIDLLITKWEFQARLPLEFGDETQPLPEPVTDFVTLHADHAKVDEAKALAGAVIAPDGRPLVVFSRPVQDRARFGSPGLDGTAPEDLGLRQFSYRLKHVVLVRTGAGAPSLVGAAGEATVSGTTVSFAGLPTPGDALPDLAGAELTLLAPGQSLGPFTIASGGGTTATLSASGPQGDFSYRLTAPRPRASVQVASVGTAPSGQATLTVSGTLTNPSRFRGGILVAGSAKWLILDASAGSVKVRIDSVVPSPGAASVEGPSPPAIEGKWYPAGDPVTGPDSSTRLQLWASTPYSFFRHNDQTEIEGLDAFRPGYACGPVAVEEPICTTFDDVTAGTLNGALQTAGVAFTVSGLVAATATGAGTAKRLELGDFSHNRSAGAVVFTFDPPADAVWVTAETREGGWITASREGATLARVPIERKPTRQEFNGGIDRVEISGTLASIHRLCFTPGWTCVTFAAASFPQGQSGSVGYAGIALRSDGQMAVDNGTLEVEPPLPTIDVNLGRATITRADETSPRLMSVSYAMTAEPSGLPPEFEADFGKVELTIPIAKLVESVLMKIPGVGLVRLKEGFSSIAVPGDVLDPKITLLPERYTALDPRRDREYLLPRENIVDTGRVWVEASKTKIATLTVEFPRPVTRVRVRLENAAEVLGFGGQTEVCRSSGASGTVVSLYADPAAAAHIGWIDKIVIIASSQVRVSEVCTDAGDFGWQRFEQWKWSQGVQRSVESLYTVDPVLAPGSYELRVHTATVVTGAEPSETYGRAGGSFTVGAPPGFPVDPVSGIVPKAYPASGPLTDLATYVDGTMPAAGSRLWYRSYDTAVRFNENYVTRMYLEGGLELGVTVVNASRVPLRSGARHVWSAVDAEMEAWTELYVRTLNGDGADPCASVDLDRIVRPEQLTVGNGDPLEPAALHTSELRTGGANSRVLHRFDFTTSAFASFRHQLAGFDGRCRRLPRAAAAVASNLSPGQRATARIAQLASVGTAAVTARTAQAAVTGRAPSATIEAAATAKGALKQLRNATRTAGVADFEAIWAACFGTAQPAALPDSLKVSVVEAAAGGASVLFLESPEPVAWERVTLAAVRYASVPQRKSIAILNTDFGRPDRNFEVSFGGLLWRAGVELWVVDGALKARANEPLSVTIVPERASAVELVIRIDTGGAATITCMPPLPGGPVVRAPSASPVTISLQAPAGTLISSVLVAGTGVAVESCSVTGPFVPVTPAGPLRIADLSLPTQAAPLDHEITLLALEPTSTSGYTVRWYDAQTPGPSQLYASVAATNLKAGQRLRLVPARATAQLIDDALVQAGGPGTSPPSTGAVYQLIDAAGRIVHECAAMPETPGNAVPIVAFPGADGTRAFLVPMASVASFGSGYWMVTAALEGDVGPDLDRWSIAGRTVRESADLRFLIV